ncbi:DNA replication ATP-dependent helicase/nuclease Dna2 [Nematocida minor]|uniref:DNA replication ATP-dependent helicase/nuclease Dna2 n=1 Tax=Nematocida minor TaxID=1912983 RepID=UPI00221F7821|nr:DNA replication ATP-dependent helicase/nuclease Dna2 [Nematocida minor]KAI5193315.1 DNA replication ATP-dependent helicase/nuclease Dna2 [Nematocida minor]
MSIGWETNKQSGLNRMKINMEGELTDFNFWEGVHSLGSQLSSEIALDPKEGQAVNTFKVMSVTKTARYDKITGKNNETVYIYGDWRQGSPKIGNTVSIVPCLCCPEAIDAGDLNIITNESNYLIIHSKKSLVATNIIQSLECVRKAMLMESIEQLNRPVTKPLVHGIIIHEWLEFLIKNRGTPIPAVAMELKRIICKYTLQLYKIGEKIDKIFSEIFRHFGTLKGFISTLEYTESKESKTVHSQLLQLKGKPDIIISSSKGETEIELKTGQNLHIDNIAQVILYGLLQKEQKGYSSQRLYHLKSNACQEIKLKHSEVIHILCHRNRMVRETKMPPRKVIPHCAICNLSEICSNISKIEDSARDFPIPQSVGSQKTPISGMDMLKIMDFSNIYLFGYLWEQIQEEENRAKETAVQASVDIWDNNHLKITLSEEKTKSFFCGEFVMVYDMDMCSFGRGVISVVNQETIEIHMHERLLYDHKGLIYISKDPSLKMFAELRSSLLYLFSTEKIKKMWLEIPDKSVPPHIPSEFIEEFQDLNKDQKSALYNAVHPAPYALIHGMPGTGKTKVISLLSKIVASQKKKVLICCFTHLSLSNIEKRLEGCAALKIYRTGRTKVEDIAKSPEEIGELFDSYNIILSTTRSFFKDPIFDNRTFDMYIADEATQQNFLFSVIPTMFSSSFVLVGDHLQLHPLAKTPALGISLFELLRTRHSVSALTMQYRMPQCIMDVANAMFYNGQMKCEQKEKGSISFINATAEDAEHIVRSQKRTTQILCYFNEQARNVRMLGKEAETVDKFQGSECRDILLIVDLLLAGPPKLEILTSPERLNVGLTRAKASLKILGNAEFLKKFPLFEQLFEYLPYEEYVS